MEKNISVINVKSKKEKFDAVYREYYPKVYAFYLSKVNNQKAAEDLTSEVFLYCYKNFENYNPELASISTWIYIVSSSRWKNYCRDYRKNDNIDDYLNLSDQGEPEIEHAVWLEELKDSLKQALEELTERQRQIVVLKYYKNMSAVEIADILGTNDNNVRVQLSKALKVMRKYMNDFVED